MLLGFLRLGSYIKFIQYPVTVGFIQALRLSCSRDRCMTCSASPWGEGAGRLCRQAPGPWRRHFDHQSRRRGGGPCHHRPDCRGQAFQAKLAGDPDRGDRLCAGVLAQAAGRNHRHALRRHSQLIAAARFPPFSSDKMQAVLPDALSFALLGAIESLLSAMVADGMTAHPAGELLPARRSRSPDRGLRRAL